MTTVSTRISRTASASERAVTTMACGAVGSDTTLAPGVSSMATTPAATLASATGPEICAGAPEGPTMSCEDGTTDGAGAIATSAASGPASIATSVGAARTDSDPPPAAATFCGSAPGSERSMDGSSVPDNSNSPNASVRMMCSISVARWPAPTMRMRL